MGGQFNVRVLPFWVDLISMSSSLAIRRVFQDIHPFVRSFVDILENFSPDPLLGIKQADDWATWML